MLPPMSDVNPWAIRGNDLWINKGFADTLGWLL
jgi:hypothetical protein